MGLILNFSGASWFRVQNPTQPQYGYYNFAHYTNSTGSSKRLQSITLYLGTGTGQFYNAYTSGDVVNANGTPFTLRIYVNNTSSSIYADQYISHAVASIGPDPDGNRYPNRDNCIAYTFTFNNPPTVGAGSTVQLWWEVQGSNDSRILCFDYDRYDASEVEPNYTVTFVDGYSGTVLKTQSVPPGGDATPPANPSRPGYTFTGWSGDYTNVTSNRTITAQWRINTYTVTYNANGGSGAPGNQTKIYGQDLVLSNTTPTASWTITYNANGGTVSPTSKTVTRTFRTWNTRADGTGTNYAAGATYSANAPLTLYAQYNDPTAGTLATPSRTDCTFNRWTTSQNGGSTISSNTTITNSITIYAFWNYGVFLRGNGGTISVLNGTDYEDVEVLTNYIAHGSSFTIPNYSVSYNDSGAYDEPSRNFLGWSTSSGGSAQYSNGDSLTITGVTNLYAVFETKTFQVTFTDGFGLHSIVRTVQYGQNAIPPTNEYVQQNWAKKGYTFTGWLGSYNNVTSDRTIIALWGFTPVWMMHNGVWVEYRAREE